MKYKTTLQLSNENDSHTKIIKQVKPNSIVLEFGCACGDTTKYLKNKLNCDVYIIELDKESFNVAVEFAVRGICCDIMSYKWLEEFEEINFDYLIFADVLEHLYDPQSVLKNAIKLLKDDGELLVSLPNIAHNSVLRNLYENEFTYTETGILDKTHIRFFALQNLPIFFSQCGFKIKSLDFTSLPSNLSNMKNCDFASLLNERKLGEILQFIITLKKSEVILSELDISTVEFYPFNKKIYFDYGSGFSEQDKLNFVASNSGSFSIEFIIPANVEKIRFDPIPNCLCVLKDLHLYTTLGKKEFDLSNGSCLGAYLLFETTEPQIIYNVDKLATDSTAIIHGEIQTLNSTFQYNMITNLIKENSILNSEVSEFKRLELSYKNAKSCDELAIKNLNEKISLLNFDVLQKTLEFEVVNNDIKDLKNLNNQYLNLIDCTIRDSNQYKMLNQQYLNKIDSLTTNLNELGTKYNLITHSISWKLMWPYRYFADIIKKIGK